MSYDDDAMEEAPIFTLPPEIEFEGEPGAILKLELVERGSGGTKVRIVDEEPAEDEDLKTTLRRDMAAISEEGEM